MSPSPATKGFAELMRDVVRDLQDIVRSEIRLAKAEVREETSRAASAAKMAAAGAVLALFALGWLLVAAAEALAKAMPDWGAALVVGLCLALLGGGLLWAGFERFKEVMKSKKSQGGAA